MKLTNKQLEQMIAEALDEPKELKAPDTSALRQKMKKYQDEFAKRKQAHQDSLEFEKFAKNAKSAAGGDFFDAAVDHKDKLRAAEKAKTANPTAAINKIKANLASAVSTYETEYKHDDGPQIIFKPRTRVDADPEETLEESARLNDPLNQPYTLKITDLTRNELGKSLNNAIISMKDFSREQDMLMFFLGHHEHIKKAISDPRTIQEPLIRKTALIQKFGNLKNLPSPGNLIGSIQNIYGLFEAYFEEYAGNTNANYNQLLEKFNEKFVPRICNIYYVAYELYPKEYADDKNLDTLRQNYIDMTEVADDDGNESDLTYDDVTIALLSSEDSMKELEEFLQDTTGTKQTGHIRRLKKYLTFFAKNFFDEDWQDSDFDPDDELPQDEIGKNTTFSLTQGRFGTLVKRAARLDNALKSYVNRMIAGLLDTSEINDIKGLTESGLGSEYGYYLIKEDVTALDLEDLVQGFINANSDYTGALQQSGSAAEATALTARTRMDNLGRAIKRAKRLIDRDIPDNLGLLKKSLLNKLEYIDDTNSTVTPHMGLRDIPNFKNIATGAVGGLRGGPRQPNYAGASFGVTDLIIPPTTGSGQGGGARAGISSKTQMIFREAFPAENISMKEKFDLLNSTTNSVINGTSDDGSISQNLSKLAIVNTLSDTLLKLQGQPAGYVMEHVLAQMAVGVQTGQAMGLGDFELYSPAGFGDAAGDLEGSAKRISDTKAISQANRNWGDSFAGGRNIGYFYILMPNDATEAVIYFIGIRPRTSVHYQIQDRFILPTGSLGSGEITPPDLRNGRDFDLFDIDGNTVSNTNITLSPTKAAPGEGVRLALSALAPPRTRTLSNANLALNWQLTATLANFEVTRLNLGALDQVKANSAEYIENNINRPISRMFDLIAELKQNIDDYMVGNDVEAGTRAIENYIDLQDAINEGFDEKEEESGREIGIAQGREGDRFLKTDAGTFRGRGSSREKLSDEELANQGLSESRKMLDAMIQSILNEAKKRKK